jgi:F-type H+-transporting ATPase subunit b
MNGMFILATADLGQIARQTGETFGFDTVHFVAQLLSFLLVVVLLNHFAFDPILRVLEERRKRIAQGLADADRYKAELAKVEVQRVEILDEAARQATRMIEEARAIAAKVAETERLKAAAGAERILTQAREVAMLEQSRMRADLKRETGRLAASMAESLIGRILTPEDQDRMAGETNGMVSS